jgi:ribosomal protein S18 acetylase RimI-like enzyme
MPEIAIIDVVDATSFESIPPCADPGFDHRTCDYWEDADRGSKAARLSWLEPSRPSPEARAPARTDNPFLADLEERQAVNPFLPGSGGPAANPFARSDEDDAPNPFAPRRTERRTVGDDALPKIRLLARGLGVFGSYAKVLQVDGVSVAYSQFGPLTAYPRAQRTRELYPQLPDSPLPAVITCIASTPDARHDGHARTLVEAVCEDLSARGFTAVETYPVIGAHPDATSAATPAFWEGIGFVVAVHDERFPVMRRELG